MVVDDEIASLAGAQFNRISRSQLTGLGLSPDAVKHRVATGRLVRVEAGVFAIAPVLGHDPWGRWMAAVLTAPGSILSHLSAAIAWRLLSIPGGLETITRAGCGGRERVGGLLVHRSKSLPPEDWTVLHGIPITTVSRTLLDLTRSVSDRALARALREAVRLELLTLPELGDALGRYRGRRGVRLLGEIVARYSGLPLERARSGAEVRALEILREAARPMPGLNSRIAGEEADLSWPARRFIIEIDGGPFHLDKGEDERKEAVWRAAGWEVERIDSDDVYEHAELLLALAHSSPNVENGRPWRPSRDVR